MLNKPQVKIGLEPELREMLEAAAVARGRSIGEEVRRRLWFTFGDGNCPDQVDPALQIQAARYKRAWLTQPH